MSLYYYTGQSQCSAHVWLRKTRGKSSVAPVAASELTAVMHARPRLCVAFVTTIACTCRRARVLAAINNTREQSVRVCVHTWLHTASSADRNAVMTHRSVRLAAALGGGRRDISYVGRDDQGAALISA